MGSSISTDFAVDGCKLITTQGSYANCDADLELNDMPVCKYCQSRYKPARAMQPGRVCNSIDCQTQHALAEIERRKATQSRQKAKTERQDTQRRKEAAKTRSELIQEAEKAVRDYKRTLELMAGSGCISCGRSQEEVIGSEGWKPGGAFDGGHYIGKGARPWLRFEENNIWLQCKSCNAGSYKYARKGATVSAQFRENLIARIGLEAVEALEADNTPRKWSADDLLAIRDEYRAKLRTLRQQK